MNVKKVAVLLAGGRSRRFGRNKALARWRGLTLLEKGIRNLKAAGFDSVVAEGHTDPFPGQGPLQALFGIGCQCKPDKILLIPCDMPFLKPELFCFLWKAGASYDITVIRVGEKLLPLPGVYSGRAMEEAGRLFHKGRRDLKSLLEADLKIQQVDWEDLRDMDPQGQSLVNVNRPEDLEGVNS